MEISMYSAVSSIAFELENTDSSATIQTESVQSASNPAESASVLNESGEFLYFLTILDVSLSQ